MATVKQENRYRKLVKETNDRRNDLQRMLEAMHRERESHPISLNTQPPVSRQSVKSWMRREMADSEYGSMTELAEAANAKFELTGGGMDDETHWVYEEAYKAFEWFNAERN